MVGFNFPSIRYERYGNHEAYLGTTDEFELHESEFHKSWHWLMHVIEKINSEHDSPILRFGNVNCYCEIIGKKYVATTMIEATYKAVIEFIKQYKK